MSVFGFYSISSQMSQPMTLQMALKANQGILLIYLLSSTISSSILGLSCSKAMSLMSQFLRMKEQNRFLILFSGLPSSFLLISDHLLPYWEQYLRMSLSYSSVQSSFLILGSSLLMNRSLICFPVLVPISSASSFQFLPTFFINERMASSSSTDQIFLFPPSWENLLNLWRHWFSFLSFMQAAISPHFLGQSSQSLASFSSSSRVQVLTFLLRIFVFFCVICSLQELPSLFGETITVSSIVKTINIQKICKLPFIQYPRQCSTYQS